MKKELRRLGESSSSFCGNFILQFLKMEVNQEEPGINLLYNKGFMLQSLQQGVSKGS